MNYLLQGLLFGFAYVAPIGTQNLYIINTALQKSKAKIYQAVFLTIFFDVSLALSCFFGIGLLVERFYILKELLLLLGSIIIIYIGISTICSSSKISQNNNVESSFIKTAVSCFAVTWLNPQAIIDGSLLLGGFRASLPAGMSKYFIIGVCMASFTWFNVLGASITKFRNKINSIINIINIVCGTILIFYGIKLGYSFVKLHIMLNVWFTI